MASYNTLNSCYDFLTKDVPEIQSNRKQLGSIDFFRNLIRLIQNIMCPRKTCNAKEEIS